MVSGRYFDALRSATLEATLEAVGGGLWRLRAGDLDLSIDPKAIRISDRIGSIPRRLHLADGAEFETQDNDGVDAMLGPAPTHSSVVNLLERHWGAAVASLAGVIVVSILMVQFGLPALAGWAAARLPPATDRLIGAQTLQVLDRTVLNPSELAAQRQAQLSNLFSRMTAPLTDGHDYRMELRKSAQLGPNALALPAGIIIVTDELVQLAANDEELQAVLAHEIGHVRGRHALRHIIQGAGVSILAVVVLGDLSSVSALASAAPVLIQAKHSRDFEREADTFARQWLQQNGIAAHYFDDILCRMINAGERQGTEPPVFLSTHPSTRQRANCK
jgi:Zn-dependent protease with chaperone function